MYKQLLLLVTTFVFLNFSFCQEEPAVKGYRLKRSPSIIYVYRNKADKPDFSVWNRWDNGYWFKLDNSPAGNYKDPETKVDYIRITIESPKRWDDGKGAWTTEPGFETAVPWSDGQLIDGSDFNTWLWIRRSDFETLKDKYYGKVPGRFLLSGLTVPFKYRPSLATQPNAVISGDINLGTFAGVRFSFSEASGLSVGGSLGITSLAQNAASNTALTGNKTETIQGFDYGLAMIFDWQKKFQIGAVMGYDYGLGDLAKTYVYQQKHWFAISLNYKFLDFGKQEAAAGSSNKNSAAQVRKKK